MCTIQSNLLKTISVIINSYFLMSVSPISEGSTVSCPFTSTVLREMICRNKRLKVFFHRVTVFPCDLHIWLIVIFPRSIFFLMLIRHGFSWGRFGLNTNILVSVSVSVIRLRSFQAPSTGYAASKMRQFVTFHDIAFVGIISLCYESAPVP